MKCPKFRRQVTAVTIGDDVAEALEIGMEAPRAGAL